MRRTSAAAPEWIGWNWLSSSFLSPFRRGSLIFPAGGRATLRGLNAADRRLGTRAHGLRLSRVRRSEIDSEGHAPSARVYIGHLLLSWQKRSAHTFGSRTAGIKDDGFARQRRFVALTSMSLGKKAKGIHPCCHVVIWQRQNTKTVSGIF